MTRRYNLKVEKPEPTWWQRLFRIKPKWKSTYVEVPEGTPDYETAEYEEVLVYGKDPFVIFTPNGVVTVPNREIR